MEIPLKKVVTMHCPWWLSMIIEGRKPWWIHVTISRQARTIYSVFYSCWSKWRLESNRLFTDRLRLESSSLSRFVTRVVWIDSITLGVAQLIEHRHWLNSNRGIGFYPGWSKSIVQYSELNYPESALNTINRFGGIVSSHQTDDQTCRRSEVKKLGKLLHYSWLRILKISCVKNWTYDV